MKTTVSKSGITLTREPGDAKIYKESTVTHHARRLLNQDSPGAWARMYPDRHGLTSCRQGLKNKLTGELYWHERHQIEDAAAAFNSGSVFYLKA